MSHEINRDHPLWEAFKKWNSQHQCGVPDLDDDYDRLLFESFIAGSIQRGATSEAKGEEQ
jgi:hypothetical protein